MPNTFISLDVPGTDTAGAPAVTALAGSPKTFVIAADAVPNGRYIIEGSNDGGATWDILVGLDGTEAFFSATRTGSRTVDAIVDRVRVRSVGNGRVVAPPSITMAAPPARGVSVFGSLAVPLGEGLGAIVDLGGSAGPLKTFTMRGSIRQGSRFTVMASLDGVHFEPTVAFTGDQDGARAFSVLCRFLRVQRHGGGPTPALTFGTEGAADTTPTPSELTVSEETEHSTESLAAEEVLVEYAVPLAALSSPVLALTFAAISDQGASPGAATFRVRLGGAFGVPTGTEIARAVDTAAGETSIVANGPSFARPDQLAVAVKVTGQGDGATRVALRGFVLLFHSTSEPINQGGEVMSRDVAQRDLDMAGFHVLNVGAPQSANDATRVDNQTVPLPDSGAGSPGASFLAAPADHVHPAAAGAASTPPIETLADDGLQATSGTTEEVFREWFVDFDAITAPQILPELSAFARGSGSLNLRVGGTPGAGDGPVVATILLADAGAFHPLNNRGTAFAKPAGVQPVKLTALSGAAGVAVSARGKVVTLTGAQASGG